MASGEVPYWAAAASALRGIAGSLRARSLWTRDELRQRLRTDEIALVGVAALIGLGAGLMVAGMVALSRGVQHALFQIVQEDVSGAVAVEPVRALLVPMAGGLLVGLAALAWTRWGRASIVDPIEANALHGGRLPLAPSCFVVLQTMVSNAFGASVGMEAAYTQAGSALASAIGERMRLRRADLRILVGCGSAAAIAAAFDAPLTGAFYAFELIIGAYTLAALAPVGVASICAVGALRLVSRPISFEVGFAGTLAWSDYLLVVTLGLLCALLGIAVMRAVGLVEAVFRRLPIPVWLRPVVGGGIVGLLALMTPVVLSSGHAALHVGFGAFYGVGVLGMLIALKTIASAVSIGSGFRGGLFFASLFLGAMLGKLVAIGWMLTFGLQTPGVVIGIVGMSAMATAVLGGPLMISFLALETTGSLPLTVAVLAASIVSSMTVRRTFGYSFATWRFHLRGEAIRSPADIGWIRELSVGRIMRREIRRVSCDLTATVARRDFPLGSVQRLVLVNENGAYRGIVVVADLHREDATGETLLDYARHPTAVLLPQMNIREAGKTFASTESEELAVVESLDSMRVIGLLTEQHALRRYNDELDRRSRELAGD